MLLLRFSLVQEFLKEEKTTIPVETAIFYSSNLFCVGI